MGEVTLSYMYNTGMMSASIKFNAPNSMFVLTVLCTVDVPSVAKPIVVLYVLTTSRIPAVIQQRHLLSVTVAVWFMITPLIKQGQSIAHIYCIHKDEIPCSMKTLYNYINQNILIIRNIDLPKKVKYKVRKKKRSDHETTFAYR